MQMCSDSDCYDTTGILEIQIHLCFTTAYLPATPAKIMFKRSWNEQSKKHGYIF